MDGHKEVEQEPTFASVEKPNLFLEGMASKVKQLSPAQIREIFGKSPTVGVWRNGGTIQEKMFPDNSTFEINGRIYGVRYEEDKEGDHDLTSLKVFIYQLNKAAERMSSTIEGYERKNFPIVLTDVDIFAASSEHQITIGERYVMELARRFKRGDYSFATDIQSKFFHELIHHIRVDLHNSHKENISQLGDFLYNPRRKESTVRSIGMPLLDDGGHEVYEQEAASMFERIRSDKGLYEYRSYDKDWVNISKILLWEYRQLNPEFSIPESLLGQMKLVSRLPELYENIPQEQRDAILKKYIKLSDEDIEKAASKRGRELKLKF